MSNDLTRLLNDWRFQPDEVLVRIVPGDDGRGKVQLRVDLGILQMEMDGRPDGFRPEGFDSWLDYYESRQQMHDDVPSDLPFRLGEEDCLRLWREGIQYYHRYLSFWHLELYELCARDTARNLRLFAFVRAHAQDDRHKLQFDQWRPYVQMMHTRAVATPLLQKRHYEQALRTIEGGIDSIREFLDEYNQSERARNAPSWSAWSGGARRFSAGKSGRPPPGRKAPRNSSVRSSKRPSRPRSLNKRPGFATKSASWASSRKNRTNSSSRRGAKGADVTESAMQQFLAQSEFIDSAHPEVVAKAVELAQGDARENEVVKRCFEFVRDQIRHSWDHRLDPVTCKASDVLRYGTGYCYAKSHLLAALLRANGIPAGLCYQRLAVETGSARYSLHGLNAVHLSEHGWYRIDAQGE